MEVGEGLENVPEGYSFFVEVRALSEEVGEEVAFGGLFEHENAVRSGLFILLITREGNVLSELEAPDHMRMMQALEGDPLVLQVFLLLLAGRRHHLQHQGPLCRPVAVDLRLVTRRNQPQLAGGYAMHMNILWNSFMLRVFKYPHAL